MENTQTNIDAAKGALLSLNSDVIKAELNRIEADAQSLRVLLRAARARERSSDRKIDRKKGGSNA